MFSPFFTVVDFTNTPVNLLSRYDDDFFYCELLESVFYSVFHQFRQAKFDYCGLILINLAIKIVKIDSKVINHLATLI